MAGSAGQGGGADDPSSDYVAAAAYLQPVRLQKNSDRPVYAEAAPAAAYLEPVVRNEARTYAAAEDGLESEYTVAPAKADTWNQYVALDGPHAQYAAPGVIQQKQARASAAASGSEYAALTDCHKIYEARSNGVQDTSLA